MFTQKCTDYVCINAVSYRGQCFAVTLHDFVMICHLILIYLGK